MKHLKHWTSCWSLQTGCHFAPCIEPPFVERPHAHFILPFTLSLSHWIDARSWGVRAATQVADCFRIFQGQGRRPGSALVNSVCPPLVRVASLPVRAGHQRDPVAVWRRESGSPLTRQSELSACLTGDQRCWGHCAREVLSWPPMGQIHASRGQPPARLLSRTCLACAHSALLIFISSCKPAVAACMCVTMFVVVGQLVLRLLNLGATSAQAELKLLPT